VSDAGLPPSSRLTSQATHELDEVGTVRTLCEHSKVTDALVAKHGGRLVKSAGDVVLLEFR
jgi:hypothetical protein